MRTFFVIALLFGTLQVTAQTKPDEIIHKFFAIYKDKGSDEALDYLFGTNKWMDESQDQIENVKFKINSTVVKAMGEYYGYDIITTKSVGEKLLFYSYIVYYDRQPIRFNFLFYNPTGEWRLQNFSYDDKLASEIDEAAKAYRLPENQGY